MFAASLKKSENEASLCSCPSRVSVCTLKMSGTLSPFQLVSSVLLLLAFEIAALVRDISYRYHKKLLQTSACVVLEARSLKSVSQGLNQCVSRAMLLSEAVGEAAFPCLFRLLVAASISWLVASSLNFQGQHLQALLTLHGAPPLCV